MTLSPDTDRPEPVWLHHGRLRLALHQLRAATDPQARPLLVLHPLGTGSARVAPASATAWTGAVHALDFSGHGMSDHARGGGYTAEILMGDADAALAHLGEATVLGAGLGAYIALLIAGARPGVVRGAVLTDGPGLDGGGDRPGSPTILAAGGERMRGTSVEETPHAQPGPPAGASLVRLPDPWALVELATDVRPPDYATTFVRQASQLSGLVEPIAVSCRHEPPWLAAVTQDPSVIIVRSIGEGLMRFAG